MVEDLRQQLGIVGTCYNQSDRKRDVNQRLDNLFRSVRSENIHIRITGGKDNVTTSNVWSGLGFSGKQKPITAQDVISMQLKDIENEIVGLEANVKEFRGPCFTKAYEVMQGDCLKLQKNLDQLEVCISGREDLRSQRKQLIIKIDVLASDLASRTHEDGIICSACEVKQKF